MPTARNIMTRDVVMVDGSATAAEAVQLMTAKGIRALIVDKRSKEDAYGIVTQRDVIASRQGMPGPAAREWQTAILAV